MALDKTIFGLCFWSDDTLYPTPEELRGFLESPKTKGVRGRHDDDLARYRDLIERVAGFERYQQTGASLQNLREQMFCRAISLSQFVNPALKREVELFKYHVHGFTSLDFKKPAVFIKAAAEEMSRLNPKNRKDAVKLNRLRDMVEERKRTLEKLENRRAALAKELGNIARYVRSNLAKIGKLCEASIVILMELQTAGNMEGRLIDEVKADFRERLSDALQQGSVERKDVETAPRDVEMLSREMSFLVREDLYALAGLYEAIYNQTQRTVKELNLRMAEMESRKYRSFEENGELFTRVEQVFVSLISDYHFELKAKGVRSVTDHEKILMEKRHEMIEEVFALLGSERRIRTDRRSVETRRKVKELEASTLERRQRIGRRGRDRREPVASGAYL